MAHHHVAHHAHGHATATGVKALRTAFFVNLSFTLVEVVGGWWINSIAVMTDAVHDLGDCLVLGAAWYLQNLATKGRDARYSYGYARYSMLGGWLAAVILIVGAVFMFSVSLWRLNAPVLPHTSGMILLALFGLVMNGFAAWKLHSGSTLNERGAYLHMLEDVLGWAAVLIGGVLIHFTGWAIVDPLLSMSISSYILVNAIGTMRRGTSILMQEVPHDIDMDQIRSRLLSIPHVKDLHDQHTWTLDGSFNIHTVHIAVGEVDLPQALAIKEEARSLLASMGIHHATIELEWEGENCAMEQR